MPEKSRPILYSKLPYEMGQDFLDIQNTEFTWIKCMVLIRIIPFYRFFLWTGLWQLKHITWTLKSTLNTYCFGLGKVVFTCTLHWINWIFVYKLTVPMYAMYVMWPNQFNSLRRTFSLYDTLLWLADLWFFRLSNFKSRKKILKFTVPRYAMYVMWPGSLALSAVLFLLTSVPLAIR